MQFAAVALPLSAYLLAAYLLAVSLLALFQRRLLYRPTVGPSHPAAAGAPWMEAVRRGPRLLGWYGPAPDAAAPVLVFFHGNAGTLGRVSLKMTPWRRFGLGLFAATYRGYEGNPGSPDEVGLYADGRAVLDWLALQGIPSGRVILYGESLGSGVAAQLALERPVRGLVLEAPFVSMAEVAAHHYPWTPARLVVRDRFDTLAKIGRIACPLLILHGTADRTIPLSHSERLAGANPAAQLVVLSEAGHLDLHERGATEALQAFLAALGKPTSG